MGGGGGDSGGGGCTTVSWTTRGWPCWAWPSSSSVLPRLGGHCVVGVVGGGKGRGLLVVVAAVMVVKAILFLTRGS